MFNLNFLNRRHGFTKITCKKLKNAPYWLARLNLHHLKQSKGIVIMSFHWDPYQVNSRKNFRENRF